MKKILYLNVLLFIFFSCSATKSFTWSKQKVLQAKKIGLTKKEVIILASIIEKETKIAEEKPKIARVYLNRLEKGMLLQSAPTIEFALGKTFKGRILREDLEIDSPYNTYKYQGLPPQPICKPTKESILSVLNADKNDYLYFCFSPDLSKKMNYAKTFKEQKENQKMYMKAINKMKKE